MRLAINLMRVSLGALAVLAFSTGAASAGPIEVRDEDFGEPHCAAVAKAVHEVTGGCHFEVQSEHHIPVVLQTAGGPIVLFSCNWRLEGRMGENGGAWITEAQLTPEPVNPPTPSCTRAPCDEPDGTFIPWGSLTYELGAGNEVWELAFCLRTIASGPGGVGTTCEVHLPLSDNGGHSYEIGDSATYTCENLPAVSIQNVHFTTVSGIGEEVEIVH
jgi:hypothetical protein